jgi:YD repeat-containing protein
MLSPPHALKNELGALATSTFDAANQIQTSVAPAGMTTYTFDAAGKQIEQAPSGTTTATWNYENQRTLVLHPDSGRVIMTYNADLRSTRMEG